MWGGRYLQEEEEEEGEEEFEFEKQEEKRGGDVLGEER